MKKRSCLMLAVMLAMLQIIAVFAVVPASAASLGRTYDIALSQETPAIDGSVDACWDEVASSASFQLVTNGNNTGNEELDVKFKAVWTPAGNGKINLYILVQGTGYETTYNTIDGVRLGLNTGDVTSYTDMIRFSGSKAGNNISYENFKHGLYTGAIKADATSRTFTYEFTCQIDKPESLKLDFLVMDGSGWSNIDSYAWNGCTDAKNPEGVCNIQGTHLLNDVYVTATNGASIRLDTADETKSGIRFATTVAVPEGATIKKTGTLVLPTATLTAKNIADAAFNHASLTAAGLVEGTDYYDIENVGNKWVVENEVELTGTWYGTLYDIKAVNYERAISGIGYAVVEINGVEYTIYAEYDKDEHSRSIKQVAQLLMDTNQYEANTDEYALLVKFGAVAPTEG